MIGARPQVLIAEFRGGRLLPQVHALGWGRMWVMLQPNPIEGEPSGFDNGAFRDWTAGRDFDTAGFEKRLARAYGAIPRPIVAVAPDKVAGGLESLAFSQSWIKDLPQDWPWFLAVQDGMTLEVVEEALEPFAGIFLGGTNQFKSTSFMWARLAQKHGRLFHYGRAGTPRKLTDAYAVGADSLDSSFPLWTKARWAEFVRLWQTLPERCTTHPQSLLDFLC